MDKYAQLFKEEAFELLSELETSLLELEDQPDDSETIDRIFRSMHTIKGSAGMFGYDGVSKFTHEVETVFDLVRDGRVTVSSELINIMLAARDQIIRMLQNLDEGGDEVTEEMQNITETLRALGAEAGGQEPPRSSVPAQKSTDQPERAEDEKILWVRFRLDQDIFLTGTNPLNLITELRSLGDSEVVAHTDAIPDLQECKPEECYTWWDVIISTNRDSNAIQDVFIFVEDKCDLKIDTIAAGDEIEDETVNLRLGEILLRRGDITEEDLQSILMEQKKIGELLVSSQKVSPSQVQSALTVQETLKKTRAKQKRADAVSNVRVSSEKLDNLVNLVGELVVVQARLSQTAIAQNMPELNSVAEDVERLVGELRDNAMSLRMLPIGTTFSKFKRLVRDLSKELGKEVELVTEGAETELDKTVIEQLNDPLVHIIRNSLDHGIETPEQRESSGKPRCGQMKLSALHSGANVVIRISDDGAGLNTEAIRQKAIDKGLISKDSELSEHDVHALIFAPGFSTSEEVTSLSGRGVGMDVVRRNIEALRGGVDIDSVRGAGTTITIKLPLTLAIIEGLQVEIQSDYFVIPLAMVEECIELSQDDRSISDARHYVNVRDELVPYVRLREWFDIPGKPPQIEQIVIVNFDDRRVGIVVDRVIGEHQTVIKSLGKVYQNMHGLSGATIRGDGTVALILDVPILVQDVEKYEYDVYGGAIAETSPA